MSSSSATSPDSLARPPETFSFDAAVLVFRTTSSCSSEPAFLTLNLTLPAVTAFGLAFSENSSIVSLAVPPARAVAAGTRDTRVAAQRIRRRDGIPVTLRVARRSFTVRVPGQVRRGQRLGEQEALADRAPEVGQ